jgi:hypothetical protein
MLAAAVAVAAATPGQARHWHHGHRAGAAFGGFVAGAIIGAAAANAAADNYYYYDNGPYAYAPVYGAPAYPAYPAYDPYRPSCAIDMGYGRLDYGGC